MYNQKDFVGVWENAFNQQYCDDVISYFEQMKESGFSGSRQQWGKDPKHFKDDQSVNTSFEDTVCFNNTKEINRSFIDRFFSLTDEYVGDFSILAETQPQPQVFTNKIQKTEVGGGYHVWHCEDLGGKQYSGRVLTYILYLNDVEEGGETEFLYYPRRIKPKTGTLLLFPAGFTHTHRGNPPISNTKYIQTGWVEQVT